MDRCKYYTPNEIYMWSTFNCFYFWKLYFKTWRDFCIFGTYSVSMTSTHLAVLPFIISQLCPWKVNFWTKINCWWYVEYYLTCIILFWCTLTPFDVKATSNKVQIKGMVIRGGSRGGALPPLKLEKSMIFCVKSWFFSHEIPQKCSRRAERLF